jgi:hypothetical protein
VLVVFERGWSSGISFDPDVTAFAAKHRMALMLARHRAFKERENMDIETQTPGFLWSVSWNRGTLRSWLCSGAYVLRLRALPLEHYQCLCFTTANSNSGFPFCLSSS